MNELYNKIYKSAKYLSNPELRIKINCLLRGIKLGNVELACKQFGISRRSYYYWLDRLKAAEFEPKALLPKSRAPKRRPRQLGGLLEQEILSMREEFRYGPHKIAWYMNQYGFNVSGNGVYKVLIRADVPWQKHKTKKPNRHKKRYSLERPGQGLQLDIKYVPFLVQGKKTYVFNAIDDCSRWRFAYLYHNLNRDSAVDFAKRLAKTAPFTIKSIQTDNDVSFTDRFLPKSPDYDVPHPFPEILETLKILHKLIPPGIKELNGKVERSHKTDDGEFFWKQPKDITFDQLQYQLACWINDYNHYRPHQTLGMKTPAQILREKAKHLNQNKFALLKYEKQQRQKLSLTELLNQKLDQDGKYQHYFHIQQTKKPRDLLEMALAHCEIQNLPYHLCKMSEDSTFG